MLIYQRVTPLKNWAKSCCKNHHTKATAIQGSSAAFTTEPSYIGCAVHQYSCNMPIISIVMTIPHQRSELTILPTRKWSISVWMTPRGLHGNESLRSVGTTFTSETAAFFSRSFLSCRWVSQRWQHFPGTNFFENTMQHIWLTNCPVIHVIHKVSTSKDQLSRKGTAIRPLQARAFDTWGLKIWGSSCCGKSSNQIDTNNILVWSA